MCFPFTHFPCDDWENIYTLSYHHHQIEIWTITHCLGLGHETMVCAVCLAIFLWHPSLDVQCPCGHYSPQPETHNGLSILFIITTNSDNAYVHILGVFILEITLTTLAPSQARNISRRPLFVRRRQNKKGWHWYLLIKPEPKIVALVSADEARAPSQYKDRLIYIWRFPC